MKILISDIKNVLDDRLSELDRGVLITAILTSEKDVKLSLAKFKSKVGAKNARKSLIKLHELGFIRWSGYGYAKKHDMNSMVQKDVVDVIDFMNNLCGTRFSSKSKSTIVNLQNRLKDHSAEKCKLVVANRYKEWKDDAVMRKYITPHTIFRPSKFDKYLEEAERTKVGSSIVEAKKMNIKNGDIITEKECKNFSDKEIYQVRVFYVNGVRRIGSGQIRKMTGKELKRSIKLQKNNNSVKVEYIYNGE